MQASRLIHPIAHFFLHPLTSVKEKNRITQVALLALWTSASLLSLGLLIICSRWYEKRCIRLQCIRNSLPKKTVADVKYLYNNRLPMENNLQDLLEKISISAINRGIVDVFIANNEGLSRFKDRLDKAYLAWVLNKFSTSLEDPPTLRAFIPILKEIFPSEGVSEISRLVDILDAIHRIPDQITSASLEAFTTQIVQISSAFEDFAWHNNDYTNLLYTRIQVTFESIATRSTREDLDLPTLTAIKHLYDPIAKRLGLNPMIIENDVGNDSAAALCLQNEIDEDASLALARRLSQRAPARRLSPTCSIF